MQPVYKNRNAICSAARAIHAAVFGGVLAAGLMLPRSGRAFIMDGSGPLTTILVNPGPGKKPMECHTHSLGEGLDVRGDPTKWSFMVCEEPKPDAQKLPKKEKK